MSAKLTKASSGLDPKNEFTKFPFDSVLLESKVYRRVCESSWIREVSTALKDGNESNDSGPASIMSVSSNSAIVSEGDCASSSGHFGASDQHPRNVQDPMIPKLSEDTHCSPGPPPLELSVSNWSEETGESSSTNPTTKSTLATTISSIDRASVGRIIGTDGKDNHVDNSSTHVVSVVVEGVGTDSTELTIHEVSDHYEKIQESILHIRDRVLLAGGVDPGSYCGVCVSRTIEATGQLEVHRFPLTPGLLAYAVNMVKDRFYESFEIVAQFSSSDQSNGTELGCCSTTNTESTNLVQMALDTRGEPRHFAIPSRSTLPFFESSDPKHRAKGGFGLVWKVMIRPEYLEDSTFERSPGRSETPSFAVKRFRNDDSSAAMFRNEVRALRAISSSGHPHLIRLLATFRWQGFDHLLLPWAEGNLQDFWKSNPTPDFSPSTLRWMLEQFHGIADGLQHIHQSLNSPHDTRGEEEAGGTLCGRHGDIKPQNILWFRENDGCKVGDVWKISDFGLAEFHSSSIERTGPYTRGGTETYGAPELKHCFPAQILTPAYDVWSLGCVLIEAAVWVCFGSQRVDEFRRSRYARTPNNFQNFPLTSFRYKHTRHGTFFEATDGEISVSAPVKMQLRKLRQGPSGLDSRFSTRYELSQLVDTIESCLEIDARKRPSAADVASKIRTIRSIQSANQDSSAENGKVTGNSDCQRGIREVEEESGKPRRNGQSKGVS